MVAIRCGTAVVVAALCAACATPGPIQLGEVRRGEPLRATWSAPPDSAVRAVMVRQVNGSIEVASEPDGAPWRIHLAELQQLQVVRGRAIQRSSLIGAGLGGIAGILVGMVCQARCENERGTLTLAPLFGFGIGAGAGALGGLVLAPARWLDVRIR